MRPRLLPVVCFVFLCIGAVSLQAQVIVWSGAGNRFSIGTNWVGNVTPGASNTAQFGNHGGNTTIMVASATINHLEFLSTRSAVHNFTYDDGVTTLTLNGNFTVGTGPDVNFIPTGANRVDLALSAGEHVFDIGASTTVSIASLITGTGHFTKTGTGTLVLTGANTFNYTGGFGFLNSSVIHQGTVNVIGGAINHGISGDIWVGQYSGDNGTLNLSAGGDASGYYGILGHDLGSTGTATVSGVGSTWTNSNGLGVGASGTGTLTVSSGGAVSVTGPNSNIGTNALGTGTATVTGTGSTWTNAGALNVGASGNGTLTISAGGAVTNTDGRIGTFSGSIGVVTVQDTGSTWTNSSGLNVGNSGNGTLNITNGADVTSSFGYVATQAGSVGEVAVIGSGSTWTNAGLLAVGQGGHGVLTLSNGGLVTNTFGEIGYSTGSTGFVYVDDATSVWTNSSNVTVGNAGNGTLRLFNGATVNVAGGTGTITLGGSASGVGLLYVENDGNINAATITTGAGTGTFMFSTTGTLATPYYLTKDGTAGGTPVALTGSTYVTNDAGYNVLKGTNTYWGMTQVNGGTLADGAADAFSTASIIAVGGGANLDVNFNETIGGLMDGDGGGTATIAGGATLTINNTLSTGFSGALTGAGTLTKAGSGMLTLVGNLTYTGGTFVDGGTLVLDESGLSHALTDTVVGHVASSNGTLNLLFSSDLTNRIGYVGFAPSATGVVNVDGSSTSWTNTDYLYVGVQGTGSLNITNGGYVSSPNTSIGNNSNSLGTVTLNGVGSVMDNTGTLYVGAEGDGRLYVLNGASVINSTGSVGNNANITNGDGLVQVEGAGSSWTNTGQLIVGNATNGYVAAFDSGAVTALSASLGALAGVEGALAVYDAGIFATTNNLVIGGFGTGELSVSSGGTVTTGGNAILGNVTGSFGTVYLSDPGSSWTVGGSLLLGGGANGFLRMMDSAVLNVGGGTGVITLGSGAGSDGEFQLGYNGEGYEAGGIVNAASITTGTGTGTILLGTDALKASPFYLTRNGNSGGIFVTIDGGTQVQQVNGYNVLGGVSSYTGGTVITGGTLVASTPGALGSGNVQLNGGSLYVAPGITLANALSFTVGGGTLGGNGTYGSAVTAGTNVHLAPGNSVGTLTFTSGLTLAGGGTLDLEVQFATGVGGTGYDLLSISGAPLAITATSGSPFTLKVISLDAGGAPGAVTDFNAGTAYTWTFANSALGISGFSADAFVINTANFSNSLGIGSFFLTQSGNDLVLNFTPVPEPSTYALMLAGLGLAGLRAWRKRRA